MIAEFARRVPENMGPKRARAARAQPIQRNIEVDLGPSLHTPVKAVLDAPMVVPTDRLREFAPPLADFDK